MPDPTRSSVSASQVAALFDLSPYATRWLLWQYFRNPTLVPLETRPNTRLAWGKKLQSVILIAAAEHYRLDMEENVTDAYVRNGVLGCTRDGRMIDPSTGPVIVQAKNVALDVWRREWTPPPDGRAPPHIELQMQCELYAEQAPRGIIAALVGGNDLRFYERTPLPEVQASLQQAATVFFQSLADNEEPEVAGEAVELPALNRLYANRTPNLTHSAPEDAELGDWMRQLKWAGEQRAFAGKMYDTCKAHILGRIGIASQVIAPGATGRIITVKREDRQQVRIAVRLTETRPNFMADFTA